MRHTSAIIMDSAEQREWFFLENLGLRVTLILLSGITALIVDYSRMLYLRKKMVTFYSYC